MTKTLLRMSYLGDGISTDDGDLEEETGGEEGAPSVPAPVEDEEGAADGKDAFMSPDET